MVGACLLVGLEQLNIDHLSKAFLESGFAKKNSVKFNTMIIIILVDSDPIFIEIIYKVGHSI
jgi:hypothetical protein